jgi:polyhydroxyalkanoate synthesis regulator phasin
MIDTIKKTVLAGLGAAVVTADKVQEALGEVVKDGKISGAEARAVAERIAAEARQEFEQAGNALGDKVRELLAGADRGIRSRLDELEFRVAALENTPAKRRKAGK